MPFIVEFQKQLHLPTHKFSKRVPVLWFQLRNHQLVNPTQLHTLFPFPILLNLITNTVNSFPVLLVVLPEPFVFPTVSPLIHPVPFLFVLVELPIVLPPVGPLVNTPALHLIVRPIPRVFLFNANILFHPPTCRCRTRGSCSCSRTQGNCCRPSTGTCPVPASAPQHSSHCTYFHRTRIPRQKSPASRSSTFLCRWLL